MMSLSSYLTDIVHRDLKLENILVKNSPDADDNERINIKVRWWNFQSVLLVHSKGHNLHFFLLLPLYLAALNTHLVMTDSLWSSFILQPHKEKILKRITSWAQRVLCTDNEPAKANTSKTRLDHSINTPSPRLHGHPHYTFCEKLLPHVLITVFWPLLWMFLLLWRCDTSLTACTALTSMYSCEKSRGHRLLSSIVFLSKRPETKNLVRALSAHLHHLFLKCFSLPRWRTLDYQWRLVWGLTT